MLCSYCGFLMRRLFSADTLQKALALMRNKPKAILRLVSCFQSGSDVPSQHTLYDTKDQARAESRNCHRHCGCSYIFPAYIPHVLTNAAAGFPACTSPGAPVDFSETARSHLMQSLPSKRRRVRSGRGFFSLHESEQNSIVYTDYINRWQMQTDCVQLQAASEPDIPASMHIPVAKTSLVAQKVSDQLWAQRTPPLAKHAAVRAKQTHERRRRERAAQLSKGSKGSKSSSGRMQSIRWAFPSVTDPHPSSWLAHQQQNSAGMKPRDSPEIQPVEICRKQEDDSHHDQCQDASVHCTSVAMTGTPSQPGKPMSSIPLQIRHVPSGNPESARQQGERGLIEAWRFRRAFLCPHLWQNAQPDRTLLSQARSICGCMMGWQMRAELRLTSLSVYFSSIATLQLHAM